MGQGWEGVIVMSASIDRIGILFHSILSQAPFLDGTAAATAAASAVAAACVNGKSKQKTDPSTNARSERPLAVIMTAATPHQ